MINVPIQQSEANHPSQKSVESMLDCRLDQSRKWLRVKMGRCFLARCRVLGSDESLVTVRVELEELEALTSAMLNDYLVLAFCRCPLESVQVTMRREIRAESTALKRMRPS
jgi:hypothetical protein